MALSYRDSRRAVVNDWPVTRWQAVTLIAIPLFLALVGYAAKYLSDVRLEQRRSRLARLDRQLSELYGPLFALSYAGSVAWSAASRQIRADAASFKERDLTADEQRIFRLWMTEVLMPLNRRLVDVITQNAHLLEDDEMPEVLLRVCANVLAFEVNARRWADGDFTRTWSVIPFPGAELDAYASETFRQLKREHAQLVRETSPTRQR